MKKYTSIYVMACPRTPTEQDPSLYLYELCTYDRSDYNDNNIGIAKVMVEVEFVEPEPELIRQATVQKLQQAIAKEREIFNEFVKVKEEAIQSLLALPAPQQEVTV